MQDIVMHLNQLMAWLERLTGFPVDSKQVILVALTPIFLGTFFIEWRVMVRRGQDKYFKGQLMPILTNLNLGATYQAFELVVHALIFMYAMHWVYDHRFLNVTVNGWTSCRSSFCSSSATTYSTAPATACAGSGVRTCCITAAST